MKKLSLILVVALLTAIICGCSQSENKITIDEPEKISTGDQIFHAQKEDSVEFSNNVNGKRFTLTLEQFSQRYNEISQNLGMTELINAQKWVKKDVITHDNNGVEIEYYYYNADNLNFTATVETDSQCIMNIGCGTTMGNFVAQDGENSNSDVILRKSAIMAEAVCQFPSGSTDVLQDIFYQTTFDNKESLWYQGFVFSMSTQKNKQDSQNSVMLLRVFPISDELKEEWKILEYDAT